MVPLIFPFLAEIYRLDTAMTGAVGDGYDDDFRETRVRTQAGRREVSRYEKTPVRLPVQIEDQVWDALNMVAGGNLSDKEIVFVAHRRWLLTNGYVNAETGKVLFNVGDRCGAIYTKRNKLVHTVPNPPGLFCLEVRPISYGLDGTLNLILFRFAGRPSGT